MGSTVSMSPSATVWIRTCSPGLVSEIINFRVVGSCNKMSTANKTINFTTLLAAGMAPVSNLGM
eukprot:m.131716 g.131716  ORF g.131716 m.131716 type:complete len:64 (-) comp11318_c0_seq12:152-343(-)